MGQAAGNGPARCSSHQSGQWAEHCALRCRRRKEAARAGRGRGGGPDAQARGQVRGHGDAGPADGSRRGAVSSIPRVSGGSGRHGNNFVGVGVEVWAIGNMHLLGEVSFEQVCMLVYSGSSRDEGDDLDSCQRGMCVCWRGGGLL